MKVVCTNNQKWKGFFGRTATYYCRMGDSRWASILTETKCLSIIIFRHVIRYAAIHTQTLCVRLLNKESILFQTKGHFK